MLPAQAGLRRPDADCDDAKRSWPTYGRVAERCTRKAADSVVEQSRKSAYDRPIQPTCAPRQQKKALDESRAFVGFKL